jgi:CBS domain-containing protein
MGRVADLLSAKGREVHTVSPTATVYDAVDRMVQHNVGSLLVVEATKSTASSPSGIICARSS